MKLIANLISMSMGAMLGLLVVGLSQHDVNLLIWSCTVFVVAGIIRGIILSESDE